MDYLGDNFLEANKKSNNPKKDYKTLCDILSKIYKKSREHNDSLEFIKEMKDRMIRYYRDYLIPAGHIKEKDLSFIKQYEIKTLNSEYSCFAVFDFTPEDVYILDNKLKYPDPKHSLIGNPIIDLACFAGLARDVYVMKKSDYGYELLKDFALGEVSELLKIDKIKASKIFNFGRALQCSLSSRFRIKKPDKSKLFANKSLHYLELAMGGD
jgi:hypothetical protein